MAEKKLVVLVSGNGSNLQAIIDACFSRVINAKVEAVISNKPEAFALRRARDAGIAAFAHAFIRGQDRLDYDRKLAQIIQTLSPDYILLAGWMRLLSNEFLSQFPGKVINIHPALPGQFPGTHAIERAYDAYREGKINQTGVMVHYVPDEGVDNGPVICQEAITIEASDTLENLEERIHRVEHKLYVKALKSLS